MATFLKSFLLLAFCLPVLAADYYVATTGNDGNAGTEGSPWLTISKAKSTAVAGDTVYFRTGTYNTSQSLFTVSGGVGNPITFRSYPGEVAKIGDVLGVNASNLTFYDLHMDAPVHAWPSVYQAYIQIYDSADNVIIENCSFKNLELGADGDVYRLLSTSSGGATLPANGPQNFLMKNCTMDTIFGNVITSSGAGWIIEDCSFLNCYNDILRFWGDNQTFRNNYIEGGDNYPGLGGHPDEWHIFGVLQNKAIVAGQPAVDKGGGKVGIPVTNHGFLTTQNVSITSTVNYNGVYAVETESSTNEVVITATYVSETFQAGDGIEGEGNPTVDAGNYATNITITGNHFKDNKVQVCYMSYESGRTQGPFLIKNNLFERNGYQANVGMPNTTWENNTFFECMIEGAHPLGPFSGTIRGKAHNTVIRNNAFIGCGSQTESQPPLSDSGKGWYINSTNGNQGSPGTEWDLTGCVFDYNFVCGSVANGYPAKDTAAVPYTFHFKEANGINGGDPKLDANYVPLVDSPLRGAGYDGSDIGAFQYSAGGASGTLTTPTLTVGTPAPNIWDIGADEFGATGSSVPAEFDVAGATYYAVAPAGYSYSSEQNTNYDTRKYNTLTDAEAALPATATTPLVINIIGDWTGVTDSTQVDISGTTTSAANYILVRTIGESRHQGKYDTSSTFYKLAVANRCMRAFGAHVRIDGIQMKKVSASGNNQHPVELNPPSVSSDVRFSNCVVAGLGNIAFSEIGIQAITEADQIIAIWNCIVQGISLKVGSVAIQGSGVDGNPVNVYSCSGGDAYRGLERISGTVTAKNCYFTGSDVAYNGTITKTTCASSDTSGSAGLQNIAHDTATFTNVTGGSQDYRLPEGSPLIDVGTDTSGESEPLDFATDIRGRSR